MNQECRFVESRQTNAIRRLAISLPVAKRQGYHSEAIRKEKACFQGTPLNTCVTVMGTLILGSPLGTGPQSLPECGWGRRSG